MVTFDGQRFVFEGSCEYILATVRPWRGGATGATRRPWEDSGAPGGLLLSAPSPQDGCGTNDSQPTFKILTENVVCGKSGVTCSRAIRMSLGVSGLVGVPSRQPPGARSGPLGAASACCPLCFLVHTTGSRSWGWTWGGEPPRTLAQPSAQCP